MAQITKPDANPIAAALLSWFVIGVGHIVINGQANKWVMTIVATMIGSLLCVFPGILIAILSVVDSYQTAERLKNGETIEENEYSLPLLYNICKIFSRNRNIEYLFAFFFISIVKCY